jgi:DNA-binding NtrC family response regulator
MGIPFSDVSALLVDDDFVSIELCRTLLAALGIERVVSAENGSQAKQAFQESSPSIILLDINLPDTSGIDLLSQFQDLDPGIPVIMVTADGSSKTVVECMRRGAYDYLEKPIPPNRFHASVRNALEHAALQREIRNYSSFIAGGTPLERPDCFEEIVTADEGMFAIFRYLEAISTTSQPLLITGESGTGKELIARAFHRLSGRKGEYVVLNAAGTDDAVFSDTLFGHEKGAYTGADSVRKGLIEEAEHGTLFLDEIGDLDQSSQIKLLRLFQEREYRPLGGDKPRRTDAAFVAATNVDIESAILDGSFRKDLYYRMISHRVHLPPLRERRGDIPLLVSRFLSSAAEDLGRTVPAVPKELFTLLSTYDFPGNVRELFGLVHGSLARSKGATLSLAFFREQMGERGAVQLPSTARSFDYQDIVTIFGGFPTLGETEELLINAALQQVRGNQSQAALLLGISQSTLSRYQKRNGE